MNNIAPELQKFGHTKVPSKSYKNAKAIKFLLHSAFYTSKECTCKVLSFCDFWFKFYDKFCSPYPIVDFLRISPNSKAVTLIFPSASQLALPPVTAPLKTVKVNGVGGQSEGGLYHMDEVFSFHSGDINLSEEIE